MSSAPNMDFVLFDDPQSRAAQYNINTAPINNTAQGSAHMQPLNNAFLPHQHHHQQAFNPNANFNINNHLTQIPDPSATFPMAKYNQPLAFSNPHIPIGYPAPAIPGPSSSAAAAAALAMNSQPLALGGFGAYRQPIDPRATPTPQQLASIVASQHAANAAAATAAGAAQNRPIQQGGVMPFPGALVGPAGMSAAGMGTALAQEAQRMNSNEQTSPFMGANTPLPIDAETDAIPLFPSSSSSASSSLASASCSSGHHPTMSSSQQRRSSLNSTCSSSHSHPANESNRMDVFNGSPVNPPSGSFGPPIQNLSLGGGGRLSSKSLRNHDSAADCSSSFDGPPLFPIQSSSSSSLAASSVTTPSAVSMQASHSNMSSSDTNTTAGTLTPTSDARSFLAGPSSTGTSAADSLFSIAAQQHAQNQASSSTGGIGSGSAAGWNLSGRTGNKPIFSKAEESDLLSTPKAREQPMMPMSTSWSSLFANTNNNSNNNKPAESQVWYSMEDALNSNVANVNNTNAAGGMGFDMGPSSVGNSHTALPLSLGGGFGNAPAVAPLGGGSSNTNNNGRIILRGPSAANAAAGNSASSGLSLFDPSESNDDDDDADEEGPGAVRKPMTALQAIGKGAGLSTGSYFALGSDGKGGLKASSGAGNGRQQSTSQQPTQLSMLASSTLFNSSNGVDPQQQQQQQQHDAGMLPRFAAIDENGTSDSDDYDEAELDESIRRRRREQFLMRQKQQGLGPGSAQGSNGGGGGGGNHGSASLSSSTSSLSNLPHSDSSTAGGSSSSAAAMQRARSAGSGAGSGSASANNYLGTHPGMSRRSSSSTSGEDSLMSPPIRDSAEALAHFGLGHGGGSGSGGNGAAVAPASSSSVQRNGNVNHFRSQISRGVGGGGGGGVGGGGSGAGKGKTGPPHLLSRPAVPSVGGDKVSKTNAKADAAAAAAVHLAAADRDEDEDDGDDDDGEKDEEGEDDAEDEDEEEDDEDGDDDDDYAEAAHHHHHPSSSGKPRGGSTTRGRGSGSGSAGGRNTRTSRSAAAVTSSSGSGLDTAAPAQKRRRKSPKASSAAADEPVKISTLGGSHTTSTGLTVCDYVSPLVMMGAAANGPTEGTNNGSTMSAAAVKEARCGTVFHRPYDLSRHRETIHAREEARLVKAGRLSLGDCVVMGREIAAEKVMAGATEWKCEGRNGCGSVFSRKDALLRHQRIRGHGR